MAALISSHTLTSSRAEGLPGWKNARDFGAVGDGKADDTQALRRAIDAACGLGDTAPAAAPSRVLIIPPGAYRVTETLTLTPEHNGLQILGLGTQAGYGSSSGDAAKAQNARLVWDGPKGGTLMQCWGMKWLQITGLVFYGNDSAGILLRVNSTEPNNTDQTWFKKYGKQASSGYTLTRVTFMKAEKGIVLSDDAYICSDVSNFYKVGFQYLEIGLEAFSVQNLCYRIESPEIGYVGTAFRFHGGGSVEATGVNAHHTDVIFDIDKCGINSGTYNLVNVRPEQGSRQKGRRTVLLKASGEVNINLIGAQTTTGGVMGEDADHETPAFLLGPSANVLVSASQITGKVAKLTGAAADVPTFLSFQNSRFRIGADPLGGGIEHDEHSGFRLTDCQVTLDEEKDGKYRGLSFGYISSHVVLPKDSKNTKP